MTRRSAEIDALGNVPKGLLIDGQWRGSSDGRVFVVSDPSNEEPLAQVADATVADGHAALAAAARSQTSWAAMPPRERGELLRAAYELITLRAEHFAMLMTLEMGKPLAESRAELTYGAEFFRWFSEEAVRVAGRWSPAPNGATRLLTMKHPVGPTLMITPWNFPLAMGTRKIGAAIAAGCTMVVKPAHETPLTMLALADLLQEVGVPAGVLNVIPTSRAAAVCEPLLRDPRTRKLTFTGSTAVGRLLVEQSAHQLLRVSMELGGNAPFIVFDDANLDAAVDGAMLAKMRNNGEACTAANRFLVHESLTDQFARRLADRMQALVVGRGTDPDTDVGPLIDQKALTKVSHLVDDAVAKGATLHCGGKPVGERGYFFAPTVLTGVPQEAAIEGEEIFGPVAPVTSFKTEDEVVQRANGTPYGLAAYLYTRDVTRAFRVAEALEFGMVGINQGVVSNPAAPFGGVKASGFGREGGVEGIEEYLETKYVGLAL